MAAMTTILAAAALGMGAYQIVDSKNQAKKAEAKSQADTEAMLRAEEDERRKADAERFRSAGLQSRQMARQLGNKPTASPVPAITDGAGSGGGKQMIGQ